MDHPNCFVCGGKCKNDVECACEFYCAKDRDVTFPYRKCKQCNINVCHKCIKLKGREHKWFDFNGGGVQYILKCSKCKKVDLCIDVE